MPAHVRRQPDMDLRSVALSQLSDSDLNLPKQPSRKAPSALRLAASLPVLQARYQSEEEPLSPCSTSPSKPGFDFDDEDLFDFEAETISANELATAIPIAYSGRAALISVATLAPIYKRSTPAVSRPAKLVHTFTSPAALPRRSDRPTKHANRTTGMYETAPAPAPVNFSTPLASRSRSPASRPSPLSVASSPPQLVQEPGSPTSSYADSDADESLLDEAEALIRESNEIQIRTHSTDRRGLFGDESSQDGNEVESLFEKAPTPTSYAAYDPFALDPPTLSRTATGTPTSEKFVGWKSGLGRRVGRIGRRGGSGGGGGVAAREVEM